MIKNISKIAIVILAIALVIFNQSCQTTETASIGFYNVENLFDTEYFPNAHSTHQVTVGAPLSARIAISGRF